LTHSPPGPGGIALKVDSVNPAGIHAMRFPRAKFTVRRLMLVVALITVLMGLTREVGRLRHLSREYQRKAVLSARE
jgi:hypothetical protein